MRTRIRPSVSKYTVGYSAFYRHEHFQFCFCFNIHSVWFIFSPFWGCLYHFQFLFHEDSFILMPDLNLTTLYVFLFYWDIVSYKLRFCCHNSVLLLFLSVISGIHTHRVIICQHHGQWMLPRLQHIIRNKYQLLRFM